MLPSLTATAATALPALLILAGAVDVCTRSIPNLLVLLLAASFAIFASVAGLTIAEVFAHAACALAVLACGFVFFCQKLIGGGDAKLLSAAALWFGFEKLLPFLAGTALAGGLVALAFLGVQLVRALLGQASERITTIPYGAAIAAGGLITFPDWTILT